MDGNNAIEELASNQNPTGVIAHIYDDNGINLLNTEEEVDVPSIQYINGPNNIFMNDDEMLSIMLCIFFTIKE